jgi:hypothetical protein
VDKTVKVKVFRDTKYDSLEESINDWLTDIDVENWSFEFHYSIGSSESIDTFSVLIVIREK